MADDLEFWEKSEAEEMYMLVGWRQWADAGSVSSGLPAYLVEQLKASPMKIVAGKMELYPETVDVDGLVSEVASAAEPLMRTNGNRFEMILEGRLGEATLDVTNVRQTLLNLLGNAAKFTARAP